MNETWKDIPGFEGSYQISDHGRLKSFKELKEGRILSTINNRGGYISVVLCRNNKAERSTRIHRLVAENFLSNPENLPEVNHIDGNKQNNHITNLEWVTRKQNMAHAVLANPNIIDGMKKYNQRVRPTPLIQLTLDGIYVAMFMNGAAAEKATGVCARNILQVATGAEYKPGKKRIQAGGFNWLHLITLDPDAEDHSDADKSYREFLERKRLCFDLSKRKFARGGWNRAEKHTALY